MSVEQYWAPTSLPAALEHLRGGDVTILAGGTDLIIQMKFGLKRPALIVDIKRIPELMELTLSDSGLRLGAAVPAFASAPSARSAS